jgi:hypothetical protein
MLKTTPEGMNDAKFNESLEDYRQKAQAWQEQQEAFFKLHPDYLECGVLNQLRFDALNDFVKDIACKDPSLPGSQGLVLAHDEVNKIADSLNVKAVIVCFLKLAERAKDMTRQEKLEMIFRSQLDGPLFVELLKLILFGNPNRGGGGRQVTVHYMKAA